ncbi:MAG: sialidase family protein [Thermoplasmatota archaeon]
MRRIGLLLAGLTVGAVLAGCLGTTTTTTGNGAQRDARFGSGFQYAAVDGNGLPVPVPLCHPAQANAVSPLGCNFDMTPTPGRQGNEVTIAVNPQDPRHVVGGAKDYFPADAGQCVWDGVYVSHDGGASFKDRSFDGSPWRLTTNPASFKPNYASQYWCTTDPVAYYSADGKSFYYLLMAYQGDPVTASKTCENVCDTPLGSGAVNDWAFNRAIQIVAISHDGGDTFDTFTGVFEGSYPAAFHDKGWIAASPSGAIHVMWLASVAGGNLYFRSTDGGQTYSDPFVMSSAPFASPDRATDGLTDAGQGSFVDVGTGAQVFAAWTGTTINLRRSLDEGRTWLPTQNVLAPHFVTPKGLSDRDRRGGMPAMATDRNPDSPFADSVYFAFQDACADAVWTAGCKDSGHAHVYAVASHDAGKTFGTPVRLDDDSIGDAEHFMPAVSVSPGGVVDVQWFDTRAGGTATTLDATGSTAPHPRVGQAYTYSLDGGKTWARNLAFRDLADGGWDPALSHHQDGKIFFGDYQDIDSSWQAAHPVWPDTRDGKGVKVYTATLQRPWFADGWDPAKKVAAEAFIVAHPLTEQ